MFADTPDFPFVIFDDEFEQFFAHVANASEEFVIRVFTGFVGGEKKMLLDRNEVHDADGKIFVRREIEAVALFNFFGFFHVSIEFSLVNHNSFLARLVIDKVLRR